MRCLWRQGLPKADPDSLGAVLLGVPLITGPAVLTTCILLAEIHGRSVTSIAAAVNITLAGFIFMFAHPITRVIGRTGTEDCIKSCQPASCCDCGDVDSKGNHWSAGFTKGIGYSIISYDLPIALCFTRIDFLHSFHYFFHTQGNETSYE